MGYEHLFSKGKIGGLELKNRMVMTAMGSHLENGDGTVSEGTLAFYEQRAKGGVGLIITGITRVNEDHGRAGNQICASRDEHIPGLRKLAERVHQYGTKIFLQLHHPGVIGSCAAIGGKSLASPSGIASAIVQQPARALSREEIHSLVEDFGKAAARAKEAGIDGVELHGAHNYLINEFLSPYFNRRTDEYGGSFENRFRFLKEIVESVRKHAGNDFPLVVRMSADEYLKGGYHLEEGVRIAKALDELGVDAIDVTVGGTENNRSMQVDTIVFDQGWRKHLAKAVKQVVHCPVIAVTVIREPAFADQLIQDGIVDFTGSGRSFLADPQWVEKAAQGKEEEIRKCISCLRCIDTVRAGGSICCSVNPVCGKEAEEKTLEKNGAGRLVVVAGGGPAGLEAAAVLAQREFRVVLLEKTAHLGGQVYLASNVPHKGKMQWLMDYQEQRLKKLGVEIRKNTPATAEEIERLNPYAVIDATGSSPLRPQSIPGVDGPNVLTPVEILSGAFIPEHCSVAIIGSGLTGLETAEVLTLHENAVTIIEMAETVAPGANQIIVNDILRRIDVDNAVVLTGRKLTKITENAVCYEELTGEAYELPVDYVVLSMGVKSNKDVAEALKDKGIVVKAVGDAAVTSRIFEAVCSGHKAAMELE